MSVRSTSQANRPAIARLKMVPSVATQMLLMKAERASELENACR